MFEPLPAKFSFPEAEKAVLKFWDENDIFRKSIEQRAGGSGGGTDGNAGGAKRFVFYEGPPTANGMPHPGHCLTRAMKDLFPRYRAMCGYLVERKGGWDTHGLPVEREVEKELQAAGEMKEMGKAGIEAYGVERFVLKCINSVWRYTREWEDMTRRLGFWVNLKEAYATYHQSYVESVWWSLKTLFEHKDEQGRPDPLLYQAHKVVWWWCQGGTALSAGEVGEGYRTVDDPSVYVKFPLVDGPAADVVHTSGLSRSDDSPPGPDSAAEQSGAMHYDGGERSPAPGQSGAMHYGKRTSLLVWTTTPWTLISNHFAAVHPELEYALVHDPVDDEYLYIAKPLVETIAKKVKRELKIVGTCRGNDLIGLRYIPPFREAYYDRTEAVPSLFGGQFDPEGKRLGECKFGLADIRDRRVEGRSVTTTYGLSNLRMEYVSWRVLKADFVSLDAGTGLVHEAPAFGEVDFNLLRDEAGRFTMRAMPFLCAVNPDGTFSNDAPERYRGRFIFDCDKEIIREMRDERKTQWKTPILYHQETYKHEYPFCPRAEDDKLIQYARKSWFVRTSKFKDDMLANNHAVNWLPREGIRGDREGKGGRFGDFLANNVDWALSRERFWGTPLPIWRCNKCGKMETIESFAELRGKPGATDNGFWDRKVAEHKLAGDSEMPEHLRVHKPYIDEWTFEATHSHPGAPEERCIGVMERVPEVIDCWWDAGSMPFAQWGYPHAPGSVDALANKFPADFISEAIDQTRGWFYGLLAISTLLFGRASVPADVLELHRKGLRDARDGINASPELTRELRGKTDDELDRMPGFVHVCSVQPGEPTQSSSHLIGAYPMPFRTCIVLGHMFGEDGNKMSKRLRNYKEPTYIFDQYGADAMRWYFFFAQAPWTSTRFVEANIRDAQREFLVRLYNVFSFFNIYANIDGFTPIPTPEYGHRPTKQRAEIDRWIISELHRAIRFVREKMDAFENYPAAQRLNDFVDALSNWYVRRSRDRFWRKAESPPLHGVGAGSKPAPQTDYKPAPQTDWKSAPQTGWKVAPQDQDKWDAYHTLYGCLWTLSQLIAPFTPFFAETMYQNLTGTKERRGEGAEEHRSIGAKGADGDSLRSSAPSILCPLSVHLCDYPVADESLIDESLAAEMDLVREIVSLGRGARTSAKLKVRQPLARVEVILGNREHEEWLSRHTELIADELNVKSVEFTTQAEHYVTYQVKPNFKTIGPKFGALKNEVAAALGKVDPGVARESLAGGGSLTLHLAHGPVKLTSDEVEVRLEAKPGWSASQGRAGVVVVSTELTQELRDEGLIRELIHLVQGLRKDKALAYQARIVVYIDAPAEFAAIVRKFTTIIMSECLAERIEFVSAAVATAKHAGVEMTDATVEGHALKLGIAVVADQVSPVAPPTE